MKLFVGYGYNSRDKWIKNTVISFLEDLGCEVVTGEALHGQVITQGVIDRIINADATIDFVTRREKLASGNGGY